MDFEWDEAKNQINIRKHGVAFSEAQLAFGDPGRVIVLDAMHSNNQEKRFFCFGKTGDGILTVRFTYRDGKIRIYGAGFWREGRLKYEKENEIQ
jgi:uncharacterized protein